MMDGPASTTIDPDIVTAFAVGSLTIGLFIVMTGVSPLVPIVGIAVPAVTDLLLISIIDPPGEGLRRIWAAFAGGISAAILMLLL